MCLFVYIVYKRPRTTSMDRREALIPVKCECNMKKHFNQLYW